MENRGYGYLEMIFEAGRSIVSNSGVLVTEIQYLKEGGNEELLHCRYRNERHDPSTLYQAWMQIAPLHVYPENCPIKEEIFDVVGPICETGDWLEKDEKTSKFSPEIFCCNEFRAYGT